MWLNQKQLTELFSRSKGSISEHIKHIFADGKTYEVAHYNLDMILASASF
jgi:hypothetical protein